MGKQWKQCQIYFGGGSKVTAGGDCSHEIKRCLHLRRKVMTNLDSIFKSRDIANKGPSSLGYGFSSGHVWMWDLDCEESWALKSWCFWIAVLEKTLENPLDCKEIQPDHSEGDQPWNVFGINDAKVETPVLWPPHAKCWLIGRLWCWEGLGPGREWDDRGWDGWMASLTRWTWVWVNSGSWWWTWRLGMLRFMGSQRVGHDWGTELNWTELNIRYFFPFFFKEIFNEFYLIQLNHTIMT